MIDVLFGIGIDASIRATVLAASIALVLSALRVRTSGVRHAAWTAVLAAMLLMPVLPRLVPSLPIPVPSTMAPLTGISDRAQGAASSPPLVAEPTRAGATNQIGPAEATVPAALDPASPDGSPGDRTGVHWLVVASIAYAGGVVFFVLRLLAGLIQVSHLRRTSRPIPQPVAAVDEILESPSVVTPVTIGPFEPRIILPIDWHRWPSDMLAAVVAHEREHARRRDPLIALLARLNCALFWFHPLAWWLERTLATTAEHACDDAAVKHIVTRRRYAEVLLEIADTVRRHRGRLVWQGVGVDGSGLDRRIDRVLVGDPGPDPSRRRKLLVTASCAVVMAVVIACSPQDSVPPLRERPWMTAEQKQFTELNRAARNLTLEEAAALEAALDRNPDDIATRKTLIAFYVGTGRKIQSRNDNVAARRRHALWFIAHHPDDRDLVLQWQARLSRNADPEGYAQARASWLAQIARPDAGVKILDNAALFFAESEKPLAERLLLRAQEQQPNAQRSNRLGRLYSEVIAGPIDSGSGRSGSDAAASSPYAREVRDKLDTSTDGDLLLSAARSLSSHASQSMSAADRRGLSRRYFERASRLDSRAGEMARAHLRAMYRSRSLESPFAGASRESWPSLLAQSTGSERLRQLAKVSEIEYLGAEYFDWRTRQPEGGADRSRTVQEDKERAAAGFARSKAYAREALDLAPKVSRTAEYLDALFRANIAFGLNAFREGDRESAVRHLLDASNAPALDQLTAEPRSLLEYRLVDDLLKRGERDTVIAYLERTARSRTSEQREAMTKAAAEIRDGRMAEHYQRLLARGSLYPF